MNPVAQQSVVSALPRPRTGLPGRRGERRFPHRVPCNVRWSSPVEHTHASVVGQTVNLSATGMAIQLAVPLPIGSEVEVLLPHLNGEPTRVDGMVVHTRRVNTGTHEIGIRVSPA